MNTTFKNLFSMISNKKNFYKAELAAYTVLIIATITFTSCQANGHQNNGIKDEENYIPEVLELGKENALVETNTTAKPENQQTESKEQDKTEQANINAAGAASSMSYMIFPQEEKNENSQKSLGKPIAPDGFSTMESDHFVLYEENGISKDFADNAKALGSSIMQSLEQYSPAARDNRLYIFLAHSKKASGLFAKRHSLDTINEILDNRRIYLVKNNKYAGMLAHELAHYYFGSFFTPEHPAPFWLQEGMAFYTQISLAGMESAPQWLESSMRQVSNGSGFKIETLIIIDDLDGAEEKNIRLWQAQAYSFTKFLIEYKGKNTFYDFCSAIKSGKDTKEAMLEIYKMDLGTTEKEWRMKIRNLQ